MEKTNVLKAPKLDTLIIMAERYIKLIKYEVLSTIMSRFQDEDRVFSPAVDVERTPQYFVKLRHELRKLLNTPNLAEDVVREVRRILSQIEGEIERFKKQKIIVFIKPPSILEDIAKDVTEWAGVLWVVVFGDEFAVGLGWASYLVHGYEYINRLDDHDLGLNVTGVYCDDDVCHIYVEHSLEGEERLEEDIMRNVLGIARLYFASITSGLKDLVDVSIYEMMFEQTLSKYRNAIVSIAKDFILTKVPMEDAAIKIVGNLPSVLGEEGARELRKVFEELVLAVVAKLVRRRASVAMVTAMLQGIVKEVKERFNIDVDMSEYIEMIKSRSRTRQSVRK